MARHESDRDDLWAEAVALTSRAELKLPGRTEPVLVGQRTNGWWSIYFGQDVMLQFTANGQLRRAFRDGNLYRTQGATLARLTRERTATETILRRHDLSAEALAEFRTWTHDLLFELRSALDSRTAAVERLALPCADQAQASFLEETRQMLQTIFAVEDFLAPAIRGKQ
jgi:hypothetical protein